MAQGENFFERRRDIAGQSLKRGAEAIETAFGLGGRPYGQRKLTGPEKIAYFRSQPDDQKLALWNQMDEAERQEIGNGLMGQ